jgi:hypothetical protein
MRLSPAGHHEKKTWPDPGPNPGLGAILSFLKVLGRHMVLFAVASITMAAVSSLQGLELQLPSENST